MCVCVCVCHIISLQWWLGFWWSFIILVFIVYSVISFNLSSCLLVIGRSKAVVISHLLTKSLICDENVRTTMARYKHTEDTLRRLVNNCFGRKEGNVLFNDALNTFYLRLYGVGHVVKDHSDSEKWNTLPPHWLLFPISSKGSFICIIPQTG